MQTISLPVYKNNAVHCMMFILALNNVEKIPFSKNIIVVRVLSTCIPSSPPSEVQTVG